MTRDELGRLLGPAGWIVIALLGVTTLLAILGGLGFRFDPFDLTRKRADAAEATVEVVTQDRDARAIEVDAAEDTAARVEVVQREIRTTETILQHLNIHAEAAYDAETPTDPARLDRMHGVDDGMCEQRPAVCAGPAPVARDANDRGDRMHPAPDPG